MGTAGCTYTYLSDVYYRARYSSSQQQRKYPPPLTYRPRSNSCAPSLPSPFLDLDFASSCIVLVGLSLDFGVCLVPIQFVLTPPAALLTRHCESAVDRIKQANGFNIRHTVRIVQNLAPMFASSQSRTSVRYLLPSLWCIVTLLERCNNTFRKLTFSVHCYVAFQFP